MRRKYIVSCLIFLFAAIASAWWADGKSWISHRLQMTVAYAETWKAGEERDCNSEMAGADLMLACAILPGEITQSRTWDVTLRGRVTYRETNWMCRHDGTSIVCKPTE
jgi:hypothetical protein